MEIVSYAKSAKRDARTPPAAPGPAAGIAPASPTAEGERVDWVDIAKGICIVLVVTMHSTLGVEAALGREGFMHWAVAFAKPFRLPDFFLVSGLFLGRVIDRDWRLYADKRVVHFAYFYLLWLLIQSGVKFGQVSDGSVAGFARHLAHSLVEPFSTLWFVYALAVFSIATKLLRRLPWPLLLGLAATLQILPIDTSSDFVNELCERWVYFVAGYLFAPHVFRLAGWARSHAAPALAGLLAWAFANGALALTPIDRWGATTLAELPGISLLAGLAGAVAVTVTASLIARSPAGPAGPLSRLEIPRRLSHLLPADGVPAAPPELCLAGRGCGRDRPCGDARRGALPAPGGGPRARDAPLLPLCQAGLGASEAARGGAEGAASGCETRARSARGPGRA